LNDNDLSRIINYKYAYEVWNDLIITREGTSQVKRSEVDLLRSQYENFYMLDNENIDKILTRFTKNTNGLFSLDDSIDNDQKVRTVIRALLKSWEVKATTLKELNDREEMDFFGFIENLKTHEMKIKVREERETPKKKAIAFKATPSTIDEEESSKNSDEIFAMLIRRVGKMFYKKERQSNFRRGRPQGRFEKKEEMSHCYHCKKMEHLIADYPSLQATTSRKIQKKKAMVATWDDSETESEEEIDTAHVCFMANREEISKLTLDTSLDDDELTMNELA